MEPSLARHLGGPTAMGLCLRYLGMLVLVLAWVERAEAHEDLCFDFASPTLDGLLQSSRAQRLPIVVRNSDVDARLAAKGLSLAVRRRGVEVTILRNSRALSPHDLAVEESSANQAQVVAIIEVLAGGEPRMATADFRDRAGQPLAMLSGVRAQNAQCLGVGSAPPPGASPEQLPAEDAEDEVDNRDTPESRPIREERERTWYGWQLMLADGASVVALVSPIPSFAVPTHLLAPPLIHAGNGEGQGAWLSVGLRSTIPLAGIGLGYLSAHLGACNKDSDSCHGSWVSGGLLVGMAVAAIIDDTLLAWKDTKDSDSPSYFSARRRSRKHPGVSVGFDVLPYRSGAGLGMAGCF